MQPLKSVHGANISHEGNSFKVSTGDPCLEGEDLRLFFMKYRINISPLKALRAKLDFS